MSAVSPLTQLVWIRLASGKDITWEDTNLQVDTYIDSNYDLKYLTAFFQIYKLTYLYLISESDEVKPSTDDWVAADYDGKWYIGKVLKVDLQDRDAYITFMQYASFWEVWRHLQAT